jgi:hypothetical protein
VTDRRAAARLARWLVLFVCAVLSLALGMSLFVATFEAKGPPPALPSAPAASQSRASVKLRPTERRDHEANAVAWREADALSDAELAHATVEDLQERTAVLLAEMAVPDPYIAVHSQQPVLAQMLADILADAPEVEDELAAEVDRVLCDAGSTLADQLLLAKVGMALRDAYAARGVDCAMARARRGGELREDAALWAVLELWQASGQPASPAIVELSALAREPRTLRRLRRDERGVGTASQAFTAAALAGRATDSTPPSQ